MRLIFSVVEDRETLSIEGRPSIQLLTSHSRRGQLFARFVSSARTTVLAPLGYIRQSSESESSAYCNWHGMTEIGLSATVYCDQRTYA